MNKYNVKLKWINSKDCFNFVNKLKNITEFMALSNEEKHKIIMSYPIRLRYELINLDQL